ncbi:MAG: hypothetical protein RIQ81_92 [Pseudomonadota bacterium]|jgi:arylsulfatase A-like enzyme
MFYFVCILAVILLGIQGALNSQPSLFGKKVSSLTAGIIRFYPEAAIFETLKILAAVLVVALAYGIWAKSSRAFLAKFQLKVQPGGGRRRKASVGSWLPHVLAALASYGLLLLATAIEFPALHEPVMPKVFSRFIFQAGFLMAPASLRYAAMVVLVLPLLLPLRFRRRHGSRWPRDAWRPAVGFLAAAVFLSGVFLEGVAPTTWRIRRAPVASSLEGSARRPHVIWLTVDSLRLDRLQREGFLPAMQAFRDDPSTVSFLRHHVGVPRTFPSWIEMIQGRYSAETGIRHMFPGFPSREHEFEGIVTLARDAGYQTIAISDFAGDIFPRFAGGFDTIKAPSSSLGVLIRQNIDQMFPLFNPVITSPLFRQLFPALKESPVYAAPAHLEELFVGALADAKDLTQKPLFLSLFYSTAHFPYAAPWPHYLEFSDASYPGPFWFQKNPSLSGEDQAMNAAQVKQVRALYDGALRSVDQSIARVFKTLKQRGLWDDAVVIITADHGEDLFDPGILQGHGDHLRGDQTLRVPLMIKLPASSARGKAAKDLSRRQVEVVTRSIDLAPTLAAVTGLDGFPRARHPHQGLDLSPVFTGMKVPAALADLSAYSETEIWFARSGDTFYQKNRLDYPGISHLLTFDPGHSGEIIVNPKYESMLVVSRHRSLVAGRHKLIYMPTPSGVRFELYDVIDDPQNLRDLARDVPRDLSGAGNDVLTEMKERLFSLVKRIEPRAVLVDGLLVPEGI